MLKGKVAIVTGGTSGIGAVIARAFSEHGARAVIITGTQPEKGRSAAESIGPRCKFIQCDAADEEQVKSLVDHTAAAHGGVDIMVANAGIISSRAQSVLDLDMPEFDSVMRVNARGVAVCVKQAARVMVERGIRGVIICTASAVVGKRSYGYTDYLMSKEAVVGLVRAASLQLGVHGIRVNSLSPGMVMTALSLKIGVEGEVEAAHVKVTSLKGARLTAEKVAAAAVFLASDLAGFVTGHDLLVDGGMKPRGKYAALHLTIKSSRSTTGDGVGRD